MYMYVIDNKLYSILFYSILVFASTHNKPKVATFPLLSCYLVPSSHVRLVAMATNAANPSCVVVTMVAPRFSMRLV